MTQTEQDPSKELKSAKQEAFCKAIALEGMNYTDAYGRSYNAGKMMDKSVNELASVLIKNLKISSRIEYLKKTLTEKTIEELVYTAKQSFDNLLDIQKRAKEKEVFKDEIKAEELKGKLAGLYEEVHKFRGDKDAPFETNINVNFVTKKEK